ncbi:hypothetical protein [[Flexibacter] sp. ATCC 35103]|uniref:hypothetical protein n=1 Tax=[Flexibacter] sp. ATCC 35103 TaxID=1937528 RepID=UPI0009D065A2|nr:hypothetical protein [[Flexibacter] sp. ATCC 35103]OMQ12889.1 hypothetical protein BXU01_04340 [[Flexibacter] sp. ATCC 35103]
MTHLESIDEGLKTNKPHHEIVRKIYLTYPTHVLVGNEERKFQIFNEISEYFNIPIMNIQIVGSSKTGYSFHKKTVFDSLTSDLDVAIIDSHLFQIYTESVFKITRGFTDRSGFPIYDGKSTYQQYVNCVAKGIFRPDLMPTGKKRLNWSKFFGQLSSKNKDLFKSINAGIYLSQTFFEYKQTSNINEYILTKPI